MTVEEKYNEEYQAYCKGLISKEEWQNFCTIILEIIMEENKDILKNLKEEW